MITRSAAALVGVAGVTLFMVSALVGQQPQVQPQPQPQVQPQPQFQRQPQPQIQPQVQPQVREVNKPMLGRQPGMGAVSTDSQLAQCLINANEGEIALGKLAEQRAKNQDVQQFAKLMVKDHTDFLQKLEGIARERAGATPRQPVGSRTETPRAEGSAVVGAGNTDRPIEGALPRAPEGQAIDLAALNREIGQKCLELIKKDLEEKEGSQFDKCYMGGQIGAHMHVLATLEVFRNHASPEFGALLDKGVETTKAHLNHAQKIVSSLERQ